MHASQRRWTAPQVIGLFVSFSFFLHLGSALAGPAVGQFEIKTLTVEPGEIEFQSQNAYAIGVPDRLTASDSAGGFLADDNSIARWRNALELEYGFTKFLKARIGIEYESERFDDPETFGEAQSFAELKLDEYAAEVIWVVIPRDGDGFALGLLAEYEHPAERGGARTLISGPIFEYVTGPWNLSFSPLITTFFGGERNDDGEQDEKLDFAYAARVMYDWSDQLALAIEAYGTVDRIGNTGARSEEAEVFGDFDQHRIGPVIYWTIDVPRGSGSEDEVEVSLGTGMLFGLTSATPDASLKLSLEISY